MIGGTNENNVLGLAARVPFHPADFLALLRSPQVSKELKF